jgi:MFS family permease
LFSALSHRNFRLYWSGILISATGSWVQTIAQAWLVYKLTDSELLLGVVGFLATLPFTFLGLFAGVIADRVNRRKLLMLTQSILALSAFTLGMLVSTGRVQVWHIMALALVSGCANAFDIPTRHSTVPFLVSKENMMNAIVLNSAAFNSARIIGPALAGILIARVGLSRCFFVNSASFLAVIVALLLMKIKGPSEEQRENVWSEFGQGMKYIWNRSALRTLVIMVAFPSMFAMPYATLMPVFAKNILKVGATGYGTLMSATGIGALTGALTLAYFSKSQRKGLIVSGASVMLAVMLILFANSRVFPMSLVFLVGLGLMNVTYLATTNTLVQSMVPDNLRGRVVSAYLFMFQGLGPFGQLQAGALAKAVGAPATLTIGGIICAMVAGLVLLRQPEVRRLS